MRICVFGDARSVHLQCILPELADRGVRVHLITHHPRDIRGVTIERFRVPDFGWRFPQRWKRRWMRYLRSILRSHDLVNLQFLHDWGFAPDMMSLGRLVATPWGSDIVPPPGEDPPTEERSALRREILRSCAGVTAYVPHFRAAIAAFSGRPEKEIDLLPQFVDLRLFRPMTGSRHSTHGRVGFFKGFRKVYGAEYLLRAATTILEIRPDTRFCFVGEGPEKLRCREYAAVLGVDRAIHWLPPQPHALLPHILAGWDVAVFPSLCESFGLAALEASAMELPVVASAVCGLNDTVVDGETGVLVPPAAPEALADGVLRLLEDAELRRRMGEAGRAFVAAHFERAAVITRMIALFEEMCDRAAMMV